MKIPRHSGHPTAERISGGYAQLTFQLLMNVAKELFVDYTGIEYPAHDNTKDPVWGNRREEVTIPLLVQTLCMPTTWLDQLHIE